MTDSTPQYQRATPNEAALVELWQALRQPPDLRSPELSEAKRRVDALLSAYEKVAADPDDTTYERAYTETVAHVLNSLRATPAVPDRQTRFTNEHAKGLGAVMDKLQKANGPVVLSWEEAEAVLDFAEAALAMEATTPVLEQEPYVDEVAFAIWCGRRQLLEVVGLDEALSL